MKRSAAEILREYGPFPGVERVNGVTLRRPARLVRVRRQAERLRSGERRRPVRSLDVAAHAGTAFDGKHLFQIAEDRIQKIDPQTGDVLATIPAPGGGGDFGPRLGRRDALGRAVSRPQDPSDRSARRERFCAPSNPTASSPASPGSTASCGTAPGKATRAICGASIRKRERCWRRLEMPPGVGVSGLESDGARPVLLRRRQQRQGESGAPAEVSLHGKRRSIGDFRLPNDRLRFATVGLARCPVTAGGYAVMSMEQF